MNSRKQIIGLSLILLCLLFCNGQRIFAKPEGKETEIILESFPILKGEVKLSHGSFFGYMPPRIGDSFTLNLSELESLTTLKFGDEANNYIPLSGKLKIHSIEWYENGVFKNMRLVSVGERNHRVTVDIDPYGAHPRVRIWILEESPVIRSVAFIDAEHEGDMPTKP